MHQKIEYDLWANQLVLDHIKKIEDQHILHECTRLFAHLFKAQIIWFNRIHNIQENTEIWGDYSTEQCESLLNDSPAMLEGIAANIGEAITYKDSKGNTFTNDVQEIFDHVIIHGQHHRAQISMLLRKAGDTPPATDFIYFVRFSG